MLSVKQLFLANKKGALFGAPFLYHSKLIISYPFFYYRLR
jgi:hypothetical protein